MSIGSQGFIQFTVCGICHLFPSATVWEGILDTCTLTGSRVIPFPSHLGVRQPVRSSSPSLTGLVTHEKHKVLVSWRLTLQFCSMFSAPNRGPGHREQPHVLPSSSKQLPCPCLLAMFPLSHRTSFQRP